MATSRARCAGLPGPHSPRQTMAPCEFVSNRNSNGALRFRFEMRSTRHTRPAMHPLHLRPRTVRPMAVVRLQSPLQPARASSIRAMCATTPAGFDQTRPRWSIVAPHPPAKLGGKDLFFPAAWDWWTGWLRARSMSFPTKPVNGTIFRYVRLYSDPPRKKLDPLFKTPSRTPLCSKGRAGTCPGPVERSPSPPPFVSTRLGERRILMSCPVIQPLFGAAQLSGLHHVWLARVPKSAAPASLWRVTKSPYFLTPLPA